jgi:hypothetical protein
MNLRDKLYDIASTLSHEAAGLREALSAARHRLGGLFGQSPQSKSLMVSLMTPELPGTPAAMRSILQPIVAALAVTAMGAIAGVGAMSFTVFLIAGALLYAILTYIFGIDLAMQMPDLGI